MMNEKLVNLERVVSNLAQKVDVLMAAQPTPAADTATPAATSTVGGSPEHRAATVASPVPRTPPPSAFLTLRPPTNVSSATKSTAGVTAAEHFLQATATRKTASGRPLESKSARLKAALVVTWFQKMATQAERTFLSTADDGQRRRIAQNLNDLIVAYFRYAFKSTATDLQGKPIGKVPSCLTTAGYMMMVSVIETRVGDLKKLNFIVKPEEDLFRWRRDHAPALCADLAACAAPTQQPPSSGSPPESSSADLSACATPTQQPPGSGSQPGVRCDNPVCGSGSGSGSQKRARS